MAISGVYKDVTNVMTISPETAGAKETQTLLEKLAEAQEGGTTETGSGDTVSLTSTSGETAQMLQKAAKSSGSVYLSMQSQLETLKEHFVKALNTKLEDADVDTSIPFDLTMDKDGVVHVKGDHPDKEKIEEIFANEEVLRDAFKNIETNSKFLRKAGTDRSVLFGQSGGMAAYTQNWFASSEDDIFTASFMQKSMLFAFKG